MPNRITVFAAICLLLLFSSACSTQKNTWGSRHFHEITTRYNVYFNGHESYIQGIKQLQTSYKENYSKLLPLYYVSNHNSAKGTAGSMDRTIEKSQKAIKKHSIRVKPKKKAQSKSSAAYKLFYSKEEFNPFMDDVFLMMANAQFHKADFLSAASTCSYVIRHFSTDKMVCDKAGILMARAYTELEWYYEAENILNNLNKDDLTPSLTAEFSSAFADFLIRRKKYPEAIPYLEIAVKKTHKSLEKHRWSFLLAQLYQETGKRDQAYKLYSTIPGMNPAYEMELSARIRQTEVYPGSNPKKPIKKLLRLSRSSKNTDYLDQVYYALGNLYFAAKDTAKAIESYNKALEKSTASGSHKLKTLLALGEYFYKTEQFIKAEPNYTAALVLVTKDDELYPQVSQRAEVLKALTPFLITIHDEDSLQVIAKMPEKERNTLIAGIVKAAEKKAKEEARKKSVQETLAANENAASENAKTTNPANTPEVNLSNDKSWYFYNPTTISRGLKEFQRKWGKRSLKDDWRRNNKASAFENMGTTKDNKKDTLAIDSTLTIKSDSTKSKVSDLSNGVDDPLNPNFYLKNLPFTEDKINASNDKIAEALYNAGLVYREQMENDQLSLKTFRELEKRFPESPFLENAWYITYLMLKQQKRDAEAETDRLKQITKFPESPLAKRLDDSLFIEKLIKMYQVQDTLYAQTYQYYLEHSTDSIFSIGKAVEENYPVSPLIPKFSFLQAMESARTGKPEDFHRILGSILKNYPESDLIPVIKQMLEFWDKGMRPIPSAGYTNLLTLNNDLKKDSIARIDSLAREFKFNPKEAHVMLIVYPVETTNINRLQFDVALYNFTNFLIRDYDLSFAKVGKMDVLMIRGFENAEDVIRYRSWLVFQTEKPEIKYPGIQYIMISNSNLKLLEEGVSPELYRNFFDKKYSDIKPNP